MDPKDGSYGWAPDDPRWTDMQAAGRGRLEPPPPPVPSFADADTVVGGMPPIPPAPAQWPAQPPVPSARPPLSLHTQYPSAPGVRTGYGLSTGPAAPPVIGGGTPPAPRPSGAPVPAPREPSLRLDRRTIRSRRRDDEFRRAGRAELFSDDARYSVLFTLTAIWYVPICLFLLVWVLVVGAGDGPAGPRVLSGLAWLATAAALSLGVAGLLRWARVAWRAITLSIAAALIGGGVVTIAHTLSG